MGGPQSDPRWRGPYRVRLRHRSWLDDCCNRRTNRHRRSGSDTSQRDRPGLSGRSLRSACGALSPDPRHREALQVAGLGDGQGPGRHGRRVPQPALDGGPYTYIWVDALTQRCRDGGRVVNVCIAIATAVNTNGQREILGVDVFTTEDGAAWTSFLRGLVARGLSGVKLVISDSHEGLKAAIA